MGKYFSLLAFSLLIIRLVFSQQEFITQPETQEIFENQPLQIKIDVSPDYEIQSAFLYYRTFGKLELSVIEMNIQGNTISATIPQDYVLFPYVEYYIKVLTTRGVVLNFPYQASETGNYLELMLKKREQVDEQIIILSPTEDEPITKDEFFLAISLLRTSSNVKREYTRLWLNEDEITPLVLFSQDLILLPQSRYKNLKTGLNSLKIVLYDSSGKPLSISNYTFKILTEELKQVALAPKFKYDGQVKIESNYENMRSGNFNYNRLNLLFSSGYGILKSNLNIYVTNEEKPYLQPQNRFHLALDLDFFRLFAGDHYPVYPTLIMNGKRLRGVTGNLELGFFNIQASYGEITRRIEGELLQLYSRDSAVIGPNVIPLDSAKYGQPLEE